MSTWKATAYAVALGMVAVVAAVVSLPAVAAGPEPSTVEARALAKINEARRLALVRHTGLVDVARAHSTDMARRRHLDHLGADERPASARPDPAEPNGAPDDGASPRSISCENVAYFFPGDRDPAAEIYRLWRESPPHRRCLEHEDVNVAGLGITFDGQRWWATFVAMRDHTPPDELAPSTPPTATRKHAAPSRIQPPRATPSSSVRIELPAPPETSSIDTVRPADIGLVRAEPVRVDRLSERLSRAGLIAVIVLSLAGMWATWRGGRQQIAPEAAADRP